MKKLTTEDTEDTEFFSPLCSLQLKNRRKKMRKINLVILLLLLATFVFAAKIVPMPDIIKADLIKVDGHDLVIAERASISIYSLKDFKLIKKFGKEGEGPQEFKTFMGFGITVDIYPQYIIVNSIAKISYFTRKGEFIKEKKISAGTRMTPFLGKFVGNTMNFDQKTGPMMAFNLYDSKEEKIKIICSHRLPLLKGKGTVTLLDMISQINPQYHTSVDRIVIGAKQKFEIDIYDSKGNFLKSIKRDYKKQELTDDDKNKFLEVYKIHPIYKNFWESLKNAIKVPDYFPDYKSFLVSNQKVYVQTFKKKEGRTEFLIFDLDGKYLKTSFLLLVYQDILHPYLYAIDGGKIYQLAENEDEEWELRISGINL
jgi:hypothetical protein